MRMAVVADAPVVVKLNTSSPPTPETETASRPEVLTVLAPRVTCVGETANVSLPDVPVALRVSVPDPGVSTIVSVDGIPGFIE